MKKLIALAVCSMMIGFAGQAMASATFADGDLIRVEYDSKTGVEVATDLGSLTTLQNDHGTVVGDNIALSVFGSTAVAADITVAYFTKQGTTSPYNLDVAAQSLTTVGSRTMNSSSYSNFYNVMSDYQTLPAGQQLGTSSVVTNFNTDNKSFYSTFDSAAAGAYGGYLKTFAVAEFNLGSAVAQNLYDIYVASSSSQGVVSLYPGITIYTSATGVTTINTASAAPIPPSILLMGSGLLGLIGVGRKKLFV